jgi:hypothetical protein
VPLLTLAWIVAALPAQVVGLFTATLGVGFTVSVPEAEALPQLLLSLTTTL